MAMRTTINLISGVGVLITNICISFILSPYIVRTIGVEANGFVTLANNFVAYADLIVTALNAMAARFITIAYVKEDYKKANLFYNSVFWGNLIICAVLLVPAAAFIVYMENVIEVPANILWDVKILFSVIFLGFFARTAAPNWDCGTYVTNRMDRTYLPNIGTALFRCLFLVLTFSLWTPHIWYVGMASTSVTLISLAVAGYNTHQLTPELKISFKPIICSGYAIKELVGSGIWSSLAIAGNTMMTSIDLLICNKFLGPTMMGVLAISKSLPQIMTTFSETIRGVFGPELTIAFAKGDKEGILSCINRSMKITAVIVSIPAAGIMVMSGEMYKLWMPSQNAELLQILTTLAILNYIFSTGVNVLNNVFVTVNKVKYNSVALLVTGFASIGITFLLIIFTDLDIYAVAGVSSVVMILKNLTFMLPVTSKLLGFKWYQFYPQVGVSIVCSGLIILCGNVVRWMIPVSGWFSFFGACIVIGIFGLVMNMMIVLNKNEREYVIGIFKRKLHLKRK